MPFTEETLTRLKADAAEVIGRYPRARSALLPLLQLVQSEEGYVSDDGIAFCAEILGCTQTEVRGVATFYTMYKHSLAGEYQVGVCTNTLCAIMGGDQIYAELAEHLGGAPHDSAPQGSAGDGHHDIITADGKVGLERIECNAACDYAPVIMVNWEFYDNMTPEKARQLVDDLRAGNPPAPTRGPSRLCTWKEASRILAGFGDGLAAEGPSAGPASLVGLKIAKENGWKAPEPERDSTPEPPAKTAPKTTGGTK
jgi:NADH-quinone oxidoreductase subunit E